MDSLLSTVSTLGNVYMYNRSQKLTSIFSEELQLH